MSIHNEQIIQCVICGFNTLKAISDDLGITKAAARHAIDTMVADGLLQFDKIGKRNVYKLPRSENLHDPFGLCRASSDSKAAAERSLQANVGRGFGERRTHLLEDTRRGAPSFDGDGSKYARSYGQPKQLRDIM